MLCAMRVKSPFSHSALFAFIVFELIGFPFWSDLLALRLAAQGSRARLGACSPLPQRKELRGNAEVSRCDRRACCDEQPAESEPDRRRAGVEKRPDREQPHRRDLEGVPTPRRVWRQWRTASEVAHAVVPHEVEGMARGQRGNK